MLMCWCLYIDIILSFLDVLAHASVLPRDKKLTSRDTSQGVTMVLPQHPSSPSSYKSHHISLRSTKTPSKRDDEQIDRLRVRRIRILTSSVPIASAAYSFEVFYNAILYNALAPWCSSPPQQVLVITMGPVQLTMNVVLDGGFPQGIPWAFVRNFARNMLAMTGLGFTGTYDMYYATETGFSVDVRLRILWGPRI